MQQPSPTGVRTADEVVLRLRELRAWAGVSEREVHRRLRRLRDGRGVPVFDTVRRCFTPGRKRIDAELVTDIATVLGGDAAVWRRALRSIEDVPLTTFGEVPAEVKDFTGREPELRLLTELSRRDGAVIVVEGMPGVGKTALVNRFVRRLGGRVLWGDMRGCPPAMPDRPDVTVLDGVTSEDQVLPLLKSPLTLITSRCRLSNLNAHHVPLSVFTQPEAIEYLGRVIGADRVHAEPHAATEITADTGFLPLALNSVATRIASVPGWTLADHLGRLRNTSLDLSVEERFACSYRTLPTDEQRMFRLLAAHHGSDFEAYAAAALADTDLDTAHHLLAKLARRNLLEQRVERFQFHAQMRAYAQRLSVEHDTSRTRAEARTRLVTHYRSVAASAMDLYAPYKRHPQDRSHTPAPRFANRRAASAWLDAERTNLTALEEHHAELSALLTQYLECGSHYREAEALHLSATKILDASVRAHAVRRASVIRWKTGRYGEALDGLREALAVFREFGDLAGEGTALNNLGTVLRRQGRYAEALRCYPEAIAIARRTADLDAEANARNCLGLLHLRVGRHREAEEQQLRAMAIYRDIGNQSGACRVLSDLGVIHGQTGKATQAHSCHAQAMAEADDAGDRVGLGLALARAGLLYAAKGCRKEAVERLTEALHIATQTGDCGVELEVRHGLGIAMRSLEHHRHALALATRIGAKPESEQARAAISLLHIGSPSAGIAK